jgi:predicted dehydrogenase
VVLTTPRTVERVLVAGTGSIGRRHIDNLSRLRPGLQWALIRNGARQDAFSESLRATVFGDVEQALKWKPQIAVVATPSDRHAELLPKLLRAGIATYIEKPVVTSQADLAALEHTVQETLPPTQVGCVLRFLPSVRQVKAWIEGERVGRVVRASLEVGQWLPDWRPSQDYRQSYSASRERGGGVVLDLIHEIDLACWILDTNGLLGAWGGHYSRLAIESEDSALIALSTRTGAPVAVQLDYVSRVPNRRIHIVGDEGSIEWDLINRSCRLMRAGEPDVAGQGFDVANAHSVAVGELVAAFESGSPTSMPLHEAFRSTHMAIEANQQIRLSGNPA